MLYLIQELKIGQRKKKKNKNPPRQRRPFLGAAGRHQSQTLSSARQAASRFLVSARKHFRKQIRKKQIGEKRSHRQRNKAAHRKSDVGVRSTRGAGAGGRGGEGRRRGGSAEATRLHGKGRGKKRGREMALECFIFRIFSVLLLFHLFRYLIFLAVKCWKEGYILLLCLSFAEPSSFFIGTGR